jgi:hypothetical protein
MGVIHEIRIVYVRSYLLELGSRFIMHKCDLCTIWLTDGHFKFCGHNLYIFQIL